MDITTRQALDRTLLLIRQQRLPEVSDELLLRALTDTTVAIVADDVNLGSCAAQSAITTFTSLVLLCGMKVRLVLPPAAILGYQPPLTGTELTSALCDLGDDTVPGAEVAVAERTASDDLVFVMGSTDWNGEAKEAWRLTADAWSAQLVPARSAVSPMVGDFPMGALAGATAAAAEPFRAALRTAATLSGCEVHEPWQFTHARTVRLALAPPGTPTEGFKLGRVDLVSGGALSTALLHSLLRIPGLEAHIRVFEPQSLEPSNLNRYSLMRRSMIGRPKVMMLERWQRGDRSVVRGEQCEVTEAELPDILPWAPWVFVGTDNVEARWLVQGTWPEHLVVAGTAGFMAMSSEHDRGRPCAACRHAWTENVAGDVPTVSFVSYFGGLLGAARILRWAAMGASILQEQQSEAWVDRLDEPFGFRLLPVQAQKNCALQCQSR